MFDSPLVTRLVALALDEDHARDDITARITVPVGHTSKAKVIARERLVVCGLDIVPVIIREGGWSIAVTQQVTEGTMANDGDLLVGLSGSTRELLAAERTILNFLQRLCGVATYTRDFCEGVKGLKILDTRKTMPGWRLLDKYAVRTGGATNHRFSLADMVLVKNNHIDAHPGGINGALSDVVAQKPEGMSWEVEVRNLQELRVALSFKPTMIMLDNFKDDALSEAIGVVQASGHRPLVEVSGGVSRSRLSVIEASGVDAASVGALTTQAPNVDISMRIL
jgi:nicotinate-nucleotide pyrophosphorylase (carboxylating)